MKALTVPASGLSIGQGTRSISATVSNILRKTQNAKRTTMTIAVTATVVFFAALGAICVPAIVASGLTAVTATAIATASVNESGKEGGEI